MLFSQATDPHSEMVCYMSCTRCAACVETVFSTLLPYRIGQALASWAPQLGVYMGFRYCNRRA